MSRSASRGQRRRRRRPLNVCFPRNNSHRNNLLLSLSLSPFLSLSSLADGELYSGTSADFMGRDFAIFRTLGDHHPIRTEQHDSRWLNGKKHFVKKTKKKHKTGPRIDYHFLSLFFSSMERSHSVLQFFSLRSSDCKNKIKSNSQTSQAQTQNSPFGENWPPAARELLSSHHWTAGRSFHRTWRR